MTRVQHIDFDGHRLAHRVAGSGPALVVLHLYRRPDVVQLRLLRDRWRVFEVHPLGYGFSDRVPGYGGAALPDQVHAVLDDHGVDRFVVWGHSAGGAMALCIGRATPRAAGVVCGAFSPFFALTEGRMRQMDRRLPLESGARSLWPWFKQLDWDAELAAMRCPRLIFWGSEDRQMVKTLRLAQQRLPLQEVDFVEFPGVGHEVGGDDALLAELVIPTVVSWADRRIGPSW
jgi:pimeloyl-ACP methyl ester carboxylesterase